MDPIPPSAEQTPTQEKVHPFRNVTHPENEPPMAGSALHNDDGKDADPVILATEEPVPRIVLDSVSTQLKDPEVKDFGWNVPPDRVPAPLLNRLSNDDLYTLLRRFNKQIFHVKAIHVPPTGSLDLETSQDEEYSPDKLRATLERLYMTVIVGLAAFGKHIARLRSWNEPNRTAAFCAAYSIAWIFSFLLPLFLATLIILIIEPTARSYLFPPAPLAMISASTGNIQTPKAGKLGSKDSLSGAAEAHKGEAVEQEARHFVSGFATMAVSTAAGKGPGEDGNGNAVGGELAAQGLDKTISSVDSSVPDPVAMVTGATEAKDLASGDAASEDPAKKPVESAMWDKARPAMRILTDIADGWERFGNALSPAPPFPSYTPRLRLAAPLIPLFLAQFISAAVFARATTFLLGFAFFGQPLLTRAAYWLTHRHPNWREYLELRRTLLIGVPTNAQLTLTLLRRAEAEKAPLPPPPTSADAPTATSEDSDAESELAFDTTNYSVDTDESLPSTTDEDYDHMSNDSEGKPKDNGTGSKPKAGRKIAKFLKSTVKAGIGGALGVDHIKASVGSEDSKRRIGAISDPPLTQTKELDPAEVEKIKEGREPRDTKPGPIENGEGPTVFSARMHGKKGYALLITSAVSPCVSFVFDNNRSSLINFFSRGSSSQKEINPANLDPQFMIGLHDIVELRKMGGFGWKGKMVVGWALGREILDGLEITDKEGKKIVLTAIRGRDELFNRLIAAGGQLWECW